MEIVFPSVLSNPSVYTWIYIYRFRVYIDSVGRSVPSVDRFGWKIGPAGGSARTKTQNQPTKQNKPTTNNNIINETKRKAETTTAISASAEFLLQMSRLCFVDGPRDHNNNNPTRRSTKQKHQKASVEEKKKTEKPNGNKTTKTDTKQLAEPTQHYQKQQGYTRKKKSTPFYFVCESKTGEGGGGLPTKPTLKKKN